MAQFDYEVRDTSGKLVRGTLSATTRERVARLLQESHYTVVGIYERRPRWNFVADVRRFLLAWGYQRVGTRDLALFTRQLAMLLAAGVPIARALESLHKQVWTSPYFSLVINDLLDTVLNGQALSAAFARHRQVFSNTYINLVRAGESSGGLVDILNRLSLYLERTFRLTQKLSSALVYPALVFTVTILLVVLLCSYVFPLFLSFFDGMAIKMPVLALQMMLLATFITKPWVLLLLLLGAPVVFYQLHLLSKIPKVQRTLELYLYGNPVFGPVFVAVASARFCRTAAILLECGLGQMQTLDLTGDVVGSTLVAEELEEMRTSIANGHGSFATELLKTRFFPPICGHMIAASEEAGGMPRMFDRLADFFDDRVEEGIARLLALIEPAMLLVMGLIVGVVLITVFQPIYALLESM
jgi:type IV pilus assembly protein PilC